MPPTIYCAWATRRICTCKTRLFSHCGLGQTELTCANHCIITFREFSIWVEEYLLTSTVSGRSKVSTVWSMSSSLFDTAFVNLVWYPWIKLYSSSISKAKIYNLLSEWSSLALILGESLQRILSFAELNKLIKNWRPSLDLWPLSLSNTFMMMNMGSWVDKQILDFLVVVGSMMNLESLYTFEFILQC